MKILTQKREANKVTLEIEVPFPAYQAAQEKALVKAGKEVRIPGFRPGKAPRNVVEKSVNPEVVEYRAAQDLIADLYPQVITEAKLEPVDYPNVDIVQQAKDQPFVFKLIVEVYPEVKIGKYKGLKLEKKTAAIGEPEVLQVLGRLQDRFAVTNTEGKKELLPLDDEFAKKVSAFGTLAELKAEVTKALIDEKNAEADAELRNAAIGAITAETKVEIPNAMIEREIDVMLDELKSSLAQSGLTIDDYVRGSGKELSALRAEMAHSAQVRVKGKLVLKAIADLEKIAVTPEDISQEIKQMSGGADVATIEKNLGEGGRHYIEDYLTRKKALDLVIDNAQVKTDAPAKEKE